MFFLHDSPGDVQADSGAFALTFRGVERLENPGEMLARIPGPIVADLHNRQLTVPDRANCDCAIATGVTYRLLDAPGIAGLTGRGVY